MGIYEEVKQALQDVVAPELRALQTEIKRLDEKIDLLRNVEIKRIDEKIDFLKSEIMTEIRRLGEKIDIAIQIRERLASLEAKVAAMGR
jgi:peptidoglycan hydrolase CwlO-like protein